MKSRFASVAAASAMLSSLAGCPSHTNHAGSIAGSAAGAIISSSAGSGGAALGNAGSSGAAGRDAAGASAGAGARAGSSSAGSSGGSAIPPTFATVQLVLRGGGAIMPCAAAPCHGVGGMAPPDHPLELPPNNTQQLYTNLTSYVAKDCNNTKLVTPGNPSQSALLTILTAPCGMVPRMPYMCSDQDGNCIPAEYVAAIRQWIADGAPQSEASSNAGSGVAGSGNGAGGSGR